DQTAVACRQFGQQQLLHQVIAQRGRQRRQLRVIGIFVIAQSAAAAVEIPIHVAAARLVVGGFGLGPGFRHGLLGGGGIAGQRRQGNGGVVIAFLAFEQRVVGQKLFQFLVQLEGGKLQKTDGLLQLRRQRQVLRKLELQSLFHRYRGLG